MRENGDETYLGRILALLALLRNLRPERYYCVVCLSHTTFNVLSHETLHNFTLLICLVWLFCLLFSCPIPSLHVCPSTHAFHLHISYLKRMNRTENNENLLLLLSTAKEQQIENGQQPIFRPGAAILRSCLHIIGVFRLQADYFHSEAVCSLSTVMKQGMDLIVLDKYILQHILSLSTLPDLIISLYVCRRFNEAASQVFQNFFRRGQVKTLAQAPKEDNSKDVVCTIYMASSVHSAQLCCYRVAVLVFTRLFRAGGSASHP